MRRLTHTAVAAAFIVGLFAQPIFAQRSQPAPGARVNQPSKPAKEAIKIMVLRNAKASEVQRIMLELFSRSRSTQMRIAADARTNSLIVVGSTDLLAAIEALALRLDENVAPAKSEPGKDESAAQLRQRVERLEKQVAYLLSRGSRTSSSGSGGASRSFTQARPAQPASRAYPAGTQIRARVEGLSGASLRVASAAAPGKKARKGDVLVTFDASELERAYRTQQVSAEQLIAKTRQAEAHIKNIRERLAAEEAQRTAKLELAQLALQEFNEGIRPLKMAELRAAVRQSEAKLKQVRLASGDERVVAQAVIQIEAEIEVAQTRLEVFQRFTAPKMVKELEAQVAAVERESEQLLNELRAELQASEAELAALQAPLRVANERMKYYREAIKSCRILAPHDGTVASAGVVLAPGAFVRSGQTLMVLVPTPRSSAPKKGS